MANKKKLNVNNAAGEETPTPAAAGKRLVNRLSARQQFQLAGAIQEHRDRFVRENPTLEEAAQELGKELGFCVSPSSIKTAMTAVDVTWTYGRRRRTGQGSPRYARAQLLHALRKAVVHLLQAQNLPVPEDLMLDLVEAGHLFQHGEAVAG